MSEWTETIKWHQECASNAARYVKSREAEIKRLQSSLDTIKKEHGFYLLQIKTAMEKGKGKFNRDKYLVKRKKK